MAVPPLSQLVRPELPNRILGIDPGGTTGLCVFEDNRLVKASQLELSIADIDRFLGSFLPVDMVIMEDYRVYAKLAKTHTSSGLPTLRLIGAITHWCEQNHIPYLLNMAATAKQFCTNDKLREWNLYQVGMKHANDSIRHVCYYMVFGPPRSHYKAGHRVG